MDIDMSKRNVNVEIMRIVTMLFIIMHHCVINGYGLQERLKTPIYSVDGVIVGMGGGGYAVFLGGINAVVIIGVNVFFLISGYYGIKPSLKKFLRLVFDLYIYADVFILLSILTGMEGLGFATIKLLILPFYKYWFVIVYLLLYILSPVINAGIDALKKEYAIFLAGILTLFFCVLGSVSEAAFLSLNSGYSLIFAMYLYYMGRLMNKFELLHTSQRQQIFIWALCSFLTFAGCAACVITQHYEMAWKIFSYNQFIIVAASVNFVWIFLNLPKKTDGKKWLTIASHTLAVYYIHTSVIFSYYRNLPLKWIAGNINLILQIIILIIYAVLIYAACTLIDLIKEKSIGKLESCLIDRLVLSSKVQKLDNFLNQN